MYQVSEALDKVISGSGRTFYARLNGISDGIQEIVQTNFSTPDSYFYVGGATASKIEVSMFTKSQDFVKGAEVKLEIGAIADGTIEWIPMGYFTIKEQKKDRNLLTFTAYDRLESKLAKAYKSKITKYPAESKEFLTDISKQTGVEFDTSKLSDNLIIDKILTVNDQSGEKTYKEPFDGFTMQQVVGYIAQLHGTFAICDRNGKVTFRWYEALTTDYPGKIGDAAGDYLKDQNLSFIYNTIEFLKESHTYLIKTNRYFDDLLQSETMCQISGISCDTENNHYESGTNINTNLSNPVMTQEWLDKILEKIKDTRYYPVSFSFMGDPRLDVGDVVTIVDAKNNLIDVPVMQHTITFDGGLLSEVASYGFEEKEVKSPSEIALQRVKDDILSLQEITAKKATFNQLNAVDAKVTNLQASTITVNDANILFARLDKANIKQGWITSVMIGDAQITDAKIQDMSADKLTAGILDAEKVTLINLDAGSITTGTITGLDAIFNRSFTVNSPYSDTQSFIIEANQNNIIIGTRIKDVLYSTDDNSIIFSPTGVTLQGGNGVVGITAKHDVTIGSDGGSIYLNANGTTYNDIPIYARNDLYTFKILHEGNFENLITTVENSRNSKKLSGMEIVDSSKNISNAIPWIDQTGVMEIGKYLDFHEWNADTTDFSTRLEVFEKSLRITAGITTALDLNGVGNASYIKFSGSGTTLGWIGLNRKDGSLMLYDSSEKEYRILDETSISFGTAEPISDGRKGDIYVQTSDSGNGWKKAVAIYYYSN
jgi:hypothetical phage structural protein|nr:MAG TPA: Minor structural protein [Bacteriophage sp.]